MNIAPDQRDRLTAEAHAAFPQAGVTERHRAAFVAAYVEISAATEIAGRKTGNRL